MLSSLTKLIRLLWLLDQRVEELELETKRLQKELESEKVEIETFLLPFGNVVHNDSLVQAMSSMYFFLILHF